MDLELRTIKIKQSTKEALDKLKIHPRQSYDEVIAALIPDKDKHSKQRFVYDTPREGHFEDVKEEKR